MNELDEPRPRPTAGLPLPAWWRWTVLVLMALVTFSGYFVYDSISPIAPILREEMGIGATQIGLFATLYSLPNIVMVLLGGILLDRLGTRRAGILLSLLCVAGTVLTAAGQTIVVMLAGRVLFGLGAESLILAQNKVVARYFKGRELALAFGVTIAISRLGSLVAFGGMAVISEALGWRGALWFAAFLTVAATGAFLAYVAMDRWAERRTQLPEPKEDRITWRDVLVFDRSFWYLTALCVLFYSAVFPFTYFATDFFVSGFGLSLQAAGRTTSILVFAAMVFTPVFGFFIDRYGRRAAMMVVGSLIFAPTYFVLGTTSVPPWLPMAFMGMAFSLVPAALWAAVPLLVEQRRLGTAYGLMTMVQMVGMTLVPVVAGSLSDRTGGYGAAMVLFGLLGTLGLLFAVLLLRRERGPHGHGLERPSAEAV
ncbi:MAG: MFS transporter [Candidatus Krumholzibacteriia bacterium]